jgi:hypothetical protein
VSTVWAHRRPRPHPKSEMKAFHGMLARRNECGHPRTYDPGLNEALGFTAEVMSASNRESDVALTSPPSS